MPDTPVSVSAAEFIRARTAVEDGDFKVVILDFHVIDVEPAGALGLAISTDDAQRVVHTCLASLSSFGDETATKLLGTLNAELAKNADSNGA